MIMQSVHMKELLILWKLENLMLSCVMYT